MKSSEIPSAPCFEPTWEQFQDFNEYLHSIEKEWKKYGICKIIPPKEWKEKLSFNLEEVDQMTIPAPITQYVSGTTPGVYELMLVENKPTTVGAFRERAEKETIPRSAKYKGEYDDIDRLFWRNIRFNPPIYGADMAGSLLPTDLKEWNMNELNSILRFLQQKLSGINAPYLYFGMWKAMFAWHVEDMNLFSINYIHRGAPKTWYGIPPEYGPRFERLCQTYFPDLYKKCPQFLRHKTSLVSPTLLERHNIPVYTMVHKEGEIALTYAYAYHCGFNHGFNCAESVNFALDSWIPYGLQAKSCKCESDTATLDVEQFARCYENYTQTGQFIDPLNPPPPITIPLPNTLDSLFPITTSTTNTQDILSLPVQDSLFSSTSSSYNNVTTKSIAPKKSKKHSHQNFYVAATTGTTLVVQVSSDFNESSSPSNDSPPRKKHHKRSKEEVNDESLSTEENVASPSPRKKVKRMTDEELNFLQEIYDKNPGAIPDRENRESLALKLNWTPQGIYNWFRRQAVKQKTI